MQNQAIGHWDHVLVIPAYREAPGFLQQLSTLTGTLLILVLNRPAGDPDTHCNDVLRRQVNALPLTADLESAHARLLDAAAGNHVLLIERDDALPSQEGVGLARKLGCDVALALYAQDCIDSPWIHSSDADAALPVGYFAAPAQHPQSVGLTYPYCHLPPDDPRERMAIALYERHLQQYVQGLHDANSPYAFHTLGSCLAVKSSAYAQVRGFPRRAGGEDFYLLNKLAKLGAITTPDCAPVRLSARVSDRVPFGTGPALAKLLRQENPSHAAIFYHPHCFACLGLLLGHMEAHGLPGMTLDEFSGALRETPQIADAMLELRLASFLEHAKKHCADSAAFRRQFHQWFDGFRTLKFIHAIGKTHGRLSAEELDSLCGVGQSDQG